MIPIVIYARYSSHAQTELSIEGQLRDCRAFAAQHEFQIIGEYIDRAISGRTDERPDFQRMIADAQKQAFRYVIVWKLDRFARSRYDSAFYKAKLKKCGVKVISATESISDDPEGIILEGLLEAMAEYYSANLAKHVKRGMRESALKGNVVSGSAPYGYAIKDRKPVIDDTTAPIVRLVFERYVSGTPSKQIADELNARGLKTRLGNPFNVRSINRILRHESYIGRYRHEDILIEDWCPPIVDRDLFDRVQAMLDARRRAPAALKADEPYLLQGKVYCGHCGAAMVGECGHGHGGVYRYYSCRIRKKDHTCKKKNEKKDALERAIVEQTLAYMLDETNLQSAADAIENEFETDDTAKQLADLQKQKNRLDAAVARVVDTLAECPVSARPALLSKLGQLTTQQQDAEEQIARLKSVLPVRVSREAVVAWIKQFCDGDPADSKFRERIIDAFIHRVYVYDDSFLIVYYVRDGQSKIERNLPVPLGSSAEFGFGDRAYTRRRGLHLLRDDFFIPKKSSLARFVAPPLPNRTPFASISLCVFRGSFSAFRLRASSVLLPFDLFIASFSSFRAFAAAQTRFKLEKSFAM